MPSVEYLVILNGTEILKTSLRSTLDAICHYLDLKEMQYIVEEKQLKF
jgi:hypothetical protein